MTLGHYDKWISHLRTSIPDLVRVIPMLRPEDKHRYLAFEYANGTLIPSWMASDGTLRMMALTLPAYVDNFRGIYLIEEPENGIHPSAIETVYQSRGSVYTSSQSSGRTSAENRRPGCRTKVWVSRPTTARIANKAWRKFTASCILFRQHRAHRRR